jgi:uncharacterized protein (TIGR02996 family)
MSEDEAFVRAIVDRPGDDTARLVYADWLDERDDPRGAYLRAEMEWVRTGKKVRALRALAKPLDPVWVARVSRPPVGVCCDHLTFRKSGPTVTPEDIDATEQRVGGTFGAQFRAFLLNHNGGVPKPAHLAYPEAAGELWADMDLEVGEFYRITLRNEKLPKKAGAWYGRIEHEREFLQDLFENGGGEGPNPLIARTVPFADTPNDQGYLLIGTGSKNRGKVYHFRDYCHNSDDPEYLFDFFPTFAEFLAQLRPERDST